MTEGDGRAATAPAADTSDGPTPSGAARGLADGDDDLDSRVVEPIAQSGPEVASVVAGVEDGVEEFRAELGHAGLDGGGDGGGGVLWTLKVVFELPADVAAVLSGRGEWKWGRDDGRPGCAVDGQGHGDPKPAVPFSTLH